MDAGARHEGVGKGRHRDQVLLTSFRAVAVGRAVCSKLPTAAAPSQVGVSVPGSNLQDVMTLVIAHRGASAAAPENTLEAFQRAIDLGADMIELDVRRTRDGRLVTFHDRAVGGAPVDTLTLAEMSARLGRTPALLDEVVALVRGRIRLNLELKEAGYVESALEAAAPLGAENVLVTSFIDTVVTEAKRLQPALETGLLMGIDRPPQQRIRTRLSELLPVQRAQACGADLIALHFSLARLGALSRAAAAGYPAIVWTVNDARGLREFLRDRRVAGVITDDPERALRERARIRNRAR
jgi:glycerophosphoryl diester phosphodiesterase